jgi:hypothetical protein
MTYKLLANMNQPYYHNGKVYNHGDVILERVVLTESEAAIMNLRETATKLVPNEDPQLVKAEKSAKLNQNDET